MEIVAIIFTEDNEKYYVNVHGIGNFCAKIKHAKVNRCGFMEVCRNIRGNVCYDRVWINVDKISYFVISE